MVLSHRLLFSIVDWWQRQGHAIAFPSRQESTDYPAGDGEARRWMFEPGRTHFVLLTNPESDAEYRRVHVDGGYHGQVTIGSFSLDRHVAASDNETPQFFVNLVLNSPHLRFSGLSRLEFEARSPEGLTVFVRFRSPDDNYNFSPSFELTPQWERYTVDLDELEVWSEGECATGYRVMPYGRFEFCLGDGANDLERCGVFEMRSVEIY